MPAMRELQNGGRSAGQLLKNFFKIFLRAALFVIPPLLHFRYIKAGIVPAAIPASPG
jgi:hypothetical protein